MARSPRIPKYRKHSSGQARVTLDGKDYLLGPYNSAESRQAYQRIIAEWLTRPEAIHSPEKGPGEITMNDLILAYWKFAESYYGFATNSARGDRYSLRGALRVVRSLYGRTAAREFGPRALKAVRQRMIELKWCRGYINAQVDRVRRMFRWAAEEELVPGSVYVDLKSLAGLRAGKTEAHEGGRVRPVPAEHVDASLPHMPPIIADMVRLQLLLGCRPDELCRLRPMDLDQADPRCWIYRPGSDEGKHGAHKTAHHENERLILIGPQAQALLRPYLAVDPSSFCFNPSSGERVRHAARRAARLSPLTPSQRARERKRNPRRSPSDRYDTHSYRRAIARACAKADQIAHEKNPAIPRDVILIPRFGPNRLRHNRATELRRHGLDLVKTILGHRKIETTEIYAERDLEAAKELVAQLG
jgi:integrase